MLAYFAEAWPWAELGEHIVSAAQVLRDAKELISAPERWTKGAYARDSAGHPVWEMADEAVCWCATGAVCRATINDSTLAPEALEALNNTKSSGRGVAGYNDAAGTTHEDVMAWFDRAIAAAETSQP